MRLFGKSGVGKDGDRWERRAVGYLKRRGYEIVERNFVARGGEIDIVAFKGETLVFVEVRYRGKGSKETPAESITPKKMRRIKLAVADFLRRRPAAKSLRLRFDVILFNGKNIRHIEGAFTW